MDTADATVGRTNQKLRTRSAIISACRELISSGRPVTMSGVARAALVSEPTAYRYFPDLVSLLQVALVGMWPAPAEALQPIARVRDPVKRVTFAAEFFLRRSLSHQGAARAMISATVARPQLAAHRPGFRFGFVDEALDPISGTLKLTATRINTLKRDLAGVISADALFALIDVCRASPEEAVDSLVRTAGTVTAAATRATNPRRRVNRAV